MPEKTFTLDEILKNPEFAELLERTPEEQATHESLFINNKPHSKGGNLNESLNLLGMK